MYFGRFLWVVVGFASFVNSFHIQKMCVLPNAVFTKNMDKTVDIMHQNMDHFVHQTGYAVVKIVSSILPHVDTIGHRVLHMDDVVINYFINLDNLSPELKKHIILSIIQISQNGDHFGAQMLQLYYDIVNAFM